MPDTLEQTPASTEAHTQQPSIPSELAANMAASLNAWLPQDKQIPVPQEQQQPPVETQPQQSQAETTPQQTQQQPAANTEVAPTPFQFSAFTEKYGYKTPDEAFKEIEELRQYKNSPWLDQQFKDEESANLFKAFTNGEIDKIYSYLDSQRKLNSVIGLEVNKDTAPQIVKHGMQLKYKDLEPHEIDHLYNKKFSIPAKPVQSVGEDDQEYNDRVAQWQEVANDRQMELLIEAKMMRPDLENAKKQIAFPKVIDSPDEGYAQYKQMLEQQDKLRAETQQAYKAFNPKSLESKVAFKDEANKIDFTFQFEPDADSFAKTVELVSDDEKFWKQFAMPDGTPDRLKFLRAMHFALNPERYITEAMTQAKNAALKANLPDNSTGGLVRQMPQAQEPNELDQQMKIALHGHM